LPIDEAPRSSVVGTGEKAVKYPWMPLFWGDFLANTMHLSAQEAGAYLFLIAHAWEHDGEIPGDRVRLARIAHVRHDRWKDVWKVLEPFFARNSVGTMITGPTDHGYHHERVTNELHRLGKISNKRKAAALANAQQKHSKSAANGGANAPTSTSTSNRESFLGKQEEGSAVQEHSVDPQASLELQLAQKHHLGISPDKGMDYRSPPRIKSDNPLTPIPDKPTEKKSS
jgi:uncharacterized protein YdaU (DUF1376 family)